MTDDLPLPTPGPKPGHEHVALTDLIAIRMEYERATADMHACLLDTCRRSKDPVIRAMDLSRLEQFHASIATHVQLLAQALDVLGDKPDSGREQGSHESFLMVARAAQRQACDADAPILASMQALLVIQQFNEAAWGLLLALMKDAELQRFVTHVERVCARQREHRVEIQQLYEDVALGLVRRNQVSTRTSRPLESTTARRMGLIFADTRRLGRA
jgi:hypothetical protein